MKLTAGTILMGAAAVVVVAVVAKEMGWIERIGQMLEDVFHLNDKKTMTQGKEAPPTPTPTRVVQLTPVAADATVGATAEPRKPIM